MPRPSASRRRGPNGRFLGDPNATATTAEHSVSLFTLPPEVRLAIYEFSFTGGKECTLRRLHELPPQTWTIAYKVFNNAILRTCKTIHAEALPLFYASHTFHYPAELDGVFQRPNITEAYLGWMKHLSISVTVTPYSRANLDAIVARHVQTMIEHCAKLSSFTLHVVPSSEATDPPMFSLLPIPRTLKKGAAADALKTLRPRLNRLSIVTFGDWDTLHHIRQAIADDEQWAEGDKCYAWPGLSLTNAQKTAVSVRQRRYTLAGDEDYVHPHRQCIRVFHTPRSKSEGKSREEGS